MTRFTTLSTIASLAIIAVLLAVVAINLIQINSRPSVVINTPVVDNGWREPAWFPPAQPALTEHTPGS